MNSRITDFFAQKATLKAVLLEGIHPSAVDVLRQGGYTNIVTHTKALTGDELLAALDGAHFVGVRSRTQLTAAILEAAPQLAAIGCFCIGTNQVDLKSATRLGIPVFNAPFSNTRSVAELVLAQVIMLMRGIPEKNAILHRGGWVKSAAHSYEVRGKTLGIIGYGHIGTQIGVLAEQMGMRVVFRDIEAKLPLGNAREVTSLDELLATSDVVTLHVPETPQTHQLMGAKELTAMKPGSHLINASRGTVVEIEPLADALKAGKLLGAAVDVFPVEPRTNKDEFVSPLRGLDNVIITPHIGGSTLEAQANIGVEVAEKLVRYSDNGTTTSSVNFPAVALPAQSGKHRLLHVHRNVPGVLSEINRVFSDNQINVSAQYLQTNEAIGYVVIDIDAESSELALQKLQQVPHTLRCRVLF